MANEVALSPEEVHNPPQASADPDDPTPLVSPTQIDPADVPEFERQAASTVQLSQGNLPQTVAHVDPNNPNPNLVVDTPNRYSASVQAHEMTHDIQNAAGESNPVNAQQASRSKADFEKIYGYNGTEGLAKIMADPKGISSLNDEQQASIPQTYMKEYAKAVKAKDPKALDRLNEVYQPAIKQLRNMANTSKDTIDTRPDAPGPPPAALTGDFSPVKGMASKSTAAIHIPTQAAPLTKKSKWNYNAASALGGGRQ
jgi:hypothetical protein